MNTYLSSAQLKDKAKENLTGHYGLLIGASIVIGLLSMVMSYLVVIFFPSSTPFGFFLSEAISFIVAVFLGVFNVGTTLLYLKFACGNQASFSDIFYGFRHHMEKALGISLVLNLLSLLLTLSYSIPSYLSLLTGNTTYLYMTYPCLALALVIFTPLSLMLSQCFYLLLDFPEKSASDILRLSFQITKGHRLRLFYIQVSFIPLLLLGTLSLVGLFWVMPYIQMTMANFYFDIMKPKQGI